jgi:hypothetical protein
MKIKIGLKVRAVSSIAEETISSINDNNLDFAFFNQLNELPYPRSIQIGTRIYDPGGAV